MSDTVLRQVRGETGEGVCFQSMVRTRGEGGPRVGADEGIATDGLGGGGGLEQEGQVGLGMGGDLEVDGGGGQELGGNGGAERDEVGWVGQGIAILYDLFDLIQRGLDCDLHSVLHQLLLLVLMSRES